MYEREPHDTLEPLKSFLLENGDVLNEAEPTLAMIESLHTRQIELLKKVGGHVRSDIVDLLSSKIALEQHTLRARLRESGEARKRSRENEPVLNPAFFKLERFNEELLDYL